MRQKLIAKIHVLKNRAKLEDELYRAILERVTRKSSCKDMNIYELNSVIEEFNRLWFISSDKKHSNFEYVDTTCGKLKKIIKLWILLGKKGLLREGGKEGLEKFLNNRFNTNISELNNSMSYNQSRKDKIIEALKGWERRDRVEEGVEVKWRFGVEDR